MAKKEIQRVYWDSCCFIEILNAGARAEQCVNVLEQAQRDEIRIVISSLTMGETVRPRGSETPLPVELRDKVLAFFENDYIIMVNLDRDVVRKSLDLCWNFNLKSRDALHVAAALAYQCDAFETFDQSILKLNAVVAGIAFREPIGQGQADTVEE